MILYLEILGLILVTVVVLAIILLMVGGIIKEWKKDNTQNDKVEQLYDNTLETMRTEE